MAQAMVTFFQTGRLVRLAPERYLPRSNLKKAMKLTTKNDLY